MEFHSHSGLLSHGSIAAVFRNFRNPDLWDFDSTFPVDVVRVQFYVDYLLHPAAQLLGQNMKVG